VFSFDRGPDPKPYRETEEGLAVFIKITPKSSKDAIEGCFEASDGVWCLKVRVRAQPEKGRANKALIKLMAKQLGVPQSSLTIITGTKDRNKTLLAKGEKQPIKLSISRLLS